MYSAVKCGHPCASQSLKTRNREFKYLGKKFVATFSFSKINFVKILLVQAQTMVRVDVLGENHKSNMENKIIRTLPYNIRRYQFKILIQSG